MARGAPTQETEAGEVGPFRSPPRVTSPSLPAGSTPAGEEDANVPAPAALVAAPEGPSFWRPNQWIWSPGRCWLQTEEEVAAATAREAPATLARLASPDTSPPTPPPVATARQREETEALEAAKQETTQGPQVRQTTTVAAAAAAWGGSASTPWRAPASQAPPALQSPEASSGPRSSPPLDGPVAFLL